MVTGNARQVPSESPLGLQAIESCVPLPGQGAILGPAIQDLPLSKSYRRSAELKQWRSTLASLRSIAHSFACTLYLPLAVAWRHVRFRFCTWCGEQRGSINRHGFLKFLIEIRLAGDRQGYIQWWLMRQRMDATRQCWSWSIVARLRLTVNRE
jgi:hypothetical protein